MRVILKTIRKLLPAALLFLLTGTVLQAQEVPPPRSPLFRTDTLNLKVYFKQGMHDVDTSFRDNGTALEAFKAEVYDLLSDSTAFIRHLGIRTSASPEGNTGFNQKLSENRAKSIEAWLTGPMGLDPDLIKTTAVGEDWEGLADIVRTLDQPWRDKALYIIEQVPVWITKNGVVVDGRKKRLKDLNGGNVWGWLLENVYPDLRTAGGSVSCVITHPVRELVTQTDTVVVKSVERDTVIVEQRDTVLLHETVPVEVPVAGKRWFDTSGKRLLLALRTNFLAIPLANVGVEVPLGPHWSVGADYYYPWIWRDNVHKDCTEMLAADIEARYWFNGALRTPESRLLGHSIGVYAAGGYYDFERDWFGHQGEFVNAGVDYLYACPIFGGRSHLEFELGIGYIYSFAQPYDCFEAGEKCYRRVGVKQYVRWFGPTRAQISLVWPIYTRKKGGER